jgi:hypothetical protein
MTENCGRVVRFPERAKIGADQINRLIHTVETVVDDHPQSDLIGPAISSNNARFSPVLATSELPKSSIFWLTALFATLIIGMAIFPAEVILITMLAVICTICAQPQSNRQNRD